MESLDDSGLDFSADIMVSYSEPAESDAENEKVFMARAGLDQLVDAEMALAYTWCHTDMETELLRSLLRMFPSPRPTLQYGLNSDRRAVASEMTSLR